MGGRELFKIMSCPAYCHHVMLSEVKHLGRGDN